MKYGCARVSKDEQNPAMQLAAREAAGCRQTFTDEGVSGAVAKRLARSLSNLSNLRALQGKKFFLNDARTTFIIL